MLWIDRGISEYQDDGANMLVLQWTGAYIGLKGLNIPSDRGSRALESP